MGNVDKSALHSDYKRYLDDARQAENDREYRKAKKLYVLAYEAAYEIAQHSAGELKHAYLGIVDDLIEKVESLPDESLPKIEEAASTKDKSKTSSKSDDDETHFFAATIPNVTFDDVAGMDEVKEAIKTRIIKPREYPEVYKALNKKPGGGVLMYGLPGTGKTMIAKAIANEVGAVFFDVKCSQIVQKYFGVAERNVKNLFETARQHEVAIIFFDEFESLGAKRGGNSEPMNRLMPELLSQIDGFQGSYNTLLVIAATNRPWDIDSAFLRPGRFSELLFVPLPDKEARMYIIGKAYEGIPIDPDINFEDLAVRMEGFNGADVMEFCDKSKDPAADRCISKYNGNLNGLMVTKADIEATLARMSSSVQPQDSSDLDEFRKQYHKY
jgi:SpoVK/Ycf46/Vps4 family AAA+-type ATPase